jgi:hypothetical protein
VIKQDLLLNAGVIYGLPALGISRSHPRGQTKPSQTKPTPRHLSILFTHHLPSLAIIHSFGHAFIILSLLDKHRESAKQQEAFFEIDVYRDCC